MQNSKRKTWAMIVVALLAGIMIGSAGVTLLERSNRASYNRSLLRRVRSFPRLSGDDGYSIYGSARYDDTVYHCTDVDLGTALHGRKTSDVRDAYERFAEMKRWIQRKHTVVDECNFATPSTVGRVYTYANENGMWGTLCCVYEERDDEEPDADGGRRRPDMYAVVLTEGADVKSWNKSGGGLKTLSYTPTGADLLIPPPGVHR